MDRQILDAMVKVMDIYYEYNFKTASGYENLVIGK